jgi:hypothetical protein
MNNELITTTGSLEPNSITLVLKNEPIIIINEEGFRYKGELIEDAGEVYEIFKEYLMNTIKHSTYKL